MSFLPWIVVPLYVPPHMLDPFNRMDGTGNAGGPLPWPPKTAGLFCRGAEVV